MVSACLQNIVNQGRVDTDEHTHISKVAPSVPANVTSDNEFYDSQDEHEECEHVTHEINKKSNEVLLIGKETTRTAGNVALAKQTVQNSVELYPQQESSQVDEALDFNGKTEEKLLDIIMGEMYVEEHDIYKLSTLTKDSSNGASLHPEEPEDSELKFDGNCVTEGEKKRGVDHRQDFTTDVGLILRREGPRAKVSSRRTKSASSKGSPVTSTRPSCVNLLKVKEEVELAIRVSTADILYKRSFSYVRNFHLPSNFNIYYGQLDKDSDLGRVFVYAGDINTNITNNNATFSLDK